MATRQLQRSILLAVCVAALGAAAACGGDGASGPLAAASEKNGSGSGSGNGNGTGSGTDSTGQPPATGPVASVRISPASVTVQEGYFVPMFATALNAEGRALSGKTFTWTSSNTSVVAVSDTGLLFAVAPGQSTVTATVDGHSASGQVSVVARPPEQPPVAQFTVRLSVVGAAGGPDTSKVERVSGAVVTLWRVGTAKGDTLDPRVQVATATTDAQGEVTFPDLPSAYYSVEVVPPASSPYQRGSTGFGPQREAEVRYGVRLLRKS